MTSWYSSILTKLTVSFVVLILITSGLTFMYTYGATRDALKESTRDQMTSVAGVMASQVNGDQVAQLTRGGETSATYKGLQNQLLTMRKNQPELKNAYILRVVNGQAEFLLDDLYGTDADAAATGDAYPDAEITAITAALKAPIASKEFYTDQWGTFLSGYAPVKDSTGKVVGVLGVDMDSSTVIDRQNFIGTLIYLIIGLSVLVAGAIVALFSRTMIRDIKSLNDTAARISTGDTNVEVKVRRKDEIGELADSFNRMVASLKIMMMDSPSEKK